MSPQKESMIAIPLLSCNKLIVTKNITPNSCADIIVIPEEIPSGTGNEQSTDAKNRLFFSHRKCRRFFKVSCLVMIRAVLQL